MHSRANHNPILENTLAILKTLSHSVHIQAFFRKLFSELWLYIFSIKGFVLVWNLCSPFAEYPAFVHTTEHVSIVRICEYAYLLNFQVMSSEQKQVVGSQYLQTSPLPLEHQGCGCRILLQMTLQVVLPRFLRDESTMLLPTNLSRLGKPLNRRERKLACEFGCVSENLLAVAAGVDVEVVPNIGGANVLAQNISEICAEFQHESDRHGSAGAWRHLSKMVFKHKRQRVSYHPY